MFFLDDSLGRRRVADVVSISPGAMTKYGKGEKFCHIVEMANGERLTLFQSDVEAIQRTPSSILPVEPGLQAFVGDDEDGSPLLSPVLGWANTFGGAVRPLLGTGVNDDQDAELPIVYPDGAVRYLGFNIYPSLELYRSSSADQPDT